MQAARSRIFTFSRWGTRRSASNAGSSRQPYWAMRMPLACSIMGMLASRACSRAYAEYRSRSWSVQDSCRLAWSRAVSLQASRISCKFPWSWAGIPLVVLPGT